MTTQTEKTKLVTAEDLLEMPDGNARRELIRGKIIELPFNKPHHGAAVAALGYVLGTHIKKCGLGRAYLGDPGFVLERDPDVVRAPDFAFVSNERLPKEPPPGYFEMAPDLAVEVLNDTDPAVYLEDKVRAWLSHGSKQVWIVNPLGRTVTVHRPDGTATILSENDSLEGGDVLPEFSCRVSDLFPKD